MGGGDGCRVGIVSDQCNGSIPVCVDAGLDLVSRPDIVPATVNMSARQIRTSSAAMIIMIHRAGLGA